VLDPHVEAVRCRVDEVDDDITLWPAGRDDEPAAFAGVTLLGSRRVGDRPSRIVGGR
jgi:hypothetical protein